MNAYRVVLIFCRAVALALWCRAGIQLLSGVTMMLATRAGWIGVGINLPPVSSSFLMPVGYFILTALVASFVGLFASSLSFAATGGALLEGEAILSSRKLEPQEMALARTGAGLIILFFGISGLLPSMVFAIYELIFVPITANAGSPMGRSVTIYNFIGMIIPVSLNCLVGFMLAFRLGLRRLVPPGKKGESA